MKIGILAVQGGFEAHAKVLEHLAIPYVFVTHSEQLKQTNGLILPGGESTAMLKFLTEDNFLMAIKDYARNGHSIFGTCAGAILLAKTVLNPTQISLNLLDITVERNAYGRQLSSHFGEGNYKGQKLEMVFIRAPRIVDIGAGVNVFATYQDQPVGVMHERIMVTTFHPELTRESRIHQLFIDTCQ